MEDNSHLFDKGMEVASRIIRKHIYETLIAICDDLLQDALDEREYKNFTGNTITSYACGLFVDGNFEYFTTTDSRLKDPVRAKLDKGEFEFLAPDYDGEERGFMGKVETDRDFGSDSSYYFLKSYNAKKTPGFEIVMCTGTEYSTYIETVYNANVLTDTYMNAKSILLRNFKPIKQ